MTIDIGKMLETFVRLRPQLLAFARNRRLDQSLAEDLMQDTWLKMQTAIPQADIENHAGYIRRSAANATNDHLRKERRRKDIDAEIQDILTETADDVSPERQLAGRQTLQAVNEVLEAMPERTRRIFLMNRIDGVSHRRIAEMEAITEEAVYYHIRRALERLAALRRTLEE